jgi:hypothetical protein
MYHLTATFALANGSILSGSAIKDSDTLRYVGDVMHPANAGLGDMVSAQDLISRLYNASPSFRTIIQALSTGFGTPASYTQSTDVATWMAAAHLPYGQQLIVLGSSDIEVPVIRTNDLTTALALLVADPDYVEMVSGVLA